MEILPSFGDTLMIKSQKSLHSIITTYIIGCPRVRFHVIGKSMQPLIQRGNWIVVEPIFPNMGYAQGDIILFSRADEFVVHRIVALKDQSIITQGDWTKIQDPPILQSVVIGRVVEVEKPFFTIRLNQPFGGWINHVIFWLVSHVKCLISYQ
jgi:signal peptidase I